MRGFALLLLLGVTLAGCSDSPDAATEVGAETPVVLTPETVDAPEWEIGRWWRYETSSGTTYSLVVSEDAGSDWIIDTDEDSFAFFDARSDISTMGPQRKSDLAGSQGSDRVEFFRFPLEDGKSWTTPWDGEVHTVTVYQNDDGTFDFEAKVGDDLRVSYTYDPMVRWFSQLDFYANGTLQFGSTLMESGTEYLGELIRYQLDVIEEVEAEGVGADGSTPRIDAGTDVYLDFTASCTTGSVAFAVGPQDNAGAIVTGGGDGYNWQAQCPAAVDDHLVIGTVPAGGADWGRFFESVSPDAVIDMTLTVRTKQIVEL